MGRVGSKERIARIQRRSLFEGADAKVVRALEGLPVLDGAPIRLEWRDGLRVSGGEIAEDGTEVHAAALIRERVLILDRSLRPDEAELRRILVHELFHFVWVRLGNGTRRMWEALLEREFEAGAKGELGWSAQWRKEALLTADRRQRRRPWREYVCEAFCDTAAYVLSSKKHAEFTLRTPHRKRRSEWFDDLMRQALRY